MFGLVFISFSNRGVLSFLSNTLLNRSAIVFFIIVFLGLKSLNCKINVVEIMK
jgi:hypothetical protein